MMNPHNENRHERIGASDVGAILGVSPWQNAHGLWLEKTQRLEPEKKDAAHIQFGNDLEDYLLNNSERDLGPMERNVLVPADGLGFPMAAQCDGLLKESRRPVEVKTSGIEGPVMGQWGETGTDEIPDTYLTQVSAQMLCTGADVGYLNAYLGGQGFYCYVIEAEKARRLHDIIIEQCAAFWQCVVSDTPPEIKETPALETLKRIKRIKGKVIDGGEALADIVMVYEDLRERRLAIEKEEKAVKEMMINALGQAEGATLPDGRMVTYLEITRNEQAREARVTKFRKLGIKKA